MYEVARNSTIRMIQDEITKIGGTAKYYDWDGHAETYELEDVDLLGIVGFSLTQDAKFHDIVCGIGILTQSDGGLYRLTSIVDRFYNRLVSLARYDIFNGSATKIGVATVFDGTTVSPATQVDARPAQTLSFSARLVVGAV